MCVRVCVYASVMCLHVHQLPILRFSSGVVCGVWCVVCARMVRVLQHSTAQHNTTQHNIAQHHTAQHSTPQHSTAHHNAAQHSTAQHNIAQHNTATGSQNPLNERNANTGMHGASMRAAECEPPQEYCTMSHDIVLFFPCPENCFSISSELLISASVLPSTPHATPFLRIPPFTRSPMICTVVSNPPKALMPHQFTELVAQRIALVSTLDPSPGE